MIKLWFKWFFSTNLSSTGIVSRSGKEAERATTGFAILGAVTHSYSCSVCRNPFWSRKPRRLCARWSCYKENYYVKAIK